MKEKKLNLGVEEKLLSKSSQAKIQELWDTMPNEEATLDVQREYLSNVRRFKADFAKITKHINRMTVIAQQQVMKAKMREHVDTAQSIFDFGVAAPKSKEEEVEFQ